MTPASLYSVIYALRVEETGGHEALQQEEREWMVKVETAREAAKMDRFAPDKKVPEPIAEQMREAMKLSAPAPLKKGK